MSISDAIKPTDRNLRNFGLLFGFAFLALACFFAFRNSEHFWWFVVPGAFFLLAGVFLRPVLRPIYIGWMSFALILAWINTRVILGLTFFLLFTPIGIVSRILGKDLLNQRIDKRAQTYWLRREQSRLPKSRYEQIF